MKAFIVWNEAHNEGFVTTDYVDAVQASNGSHGDVASTLAEAFFEAYGDNDDLEIEEIELANAKP